MPVDKDKVTRLVKWLQEFDPNFDPDETFSGEELLIALKQLGASDSLIAQVEEKLEE